MIEDIINLITGNLGIAFTDLVLLLTVLGSLIFFAKDLRIGAVILFILFVSEYILFVEMGLESFKVLMALFCSLVVLTLSIYITHSKTTTGVV